MAPRLRLTGFLTALGLAGLAASAGASPNSRLPLDSSRRIGFETSSASWMSIDVAPDGRRLLTEILGDLYLIPIAGGRARRITRGMGFDSQPVFSPDGKRIAFVSDRSGSENIWIAEADGEHPRQVSNLDDAILSSPEWSPDGAVLYFSRYHPSLTAYELRRQPVDGAAGEVVVPARTADATTSSLGAWPSPDGRALFLARHSGRLGSGLPSWSIVRRELESGEERTVVSAPASPRTDLILGTFFRPTLSPDGKRLAYGSRHEGQTGLRLLDLETGQDRWLAFPVQHDALEAAAWRDLLPRFDFTPDGKSILFTRGARLARLDLADGKIRPVPFTAEVDVGLGPNLRVDIAEDTGPVRVRLIQHPALSPDGSAVAFSALGRLYVMPLDGRSASRRIGSEALPSFMPTWSPDGRTIAFTSWSAREAGQVWTLDADGSSAPRRISRIPAFYTFPTFTPDGKSVLALRSSHSVRMHSYMEYGPHRQAELVAIPRSGGHGKVLTRGTMGGPPHFSSDGQTLFLNFPDGLHQMPLNGGGSRKRLAVTGPGWYFAEGDAAADDLRISPNGKWALAQIAQQLHLIAVPPNAEPVNLAEPRVRHRRITDVGADFFGWSNDGSQIFWSIGSTLYRRALDGIALEPPGGGPGVPDASPPGRGGVEAFDAPVQVPRDVPRGTLLLRGATLLTMSGSGDIEKGDLLIIDNRIAAVATAGSLDPPADATIMDMAGRFIMPGLIDTHDHYADIRRGILDFESWGPRANLAYGVTTGFDPSTLTIDTLAYRDAVDAGLMVGSRMPSTGPALFSFNRFRSLDEVRAVLRRYRDHYRTRNLKQYRAGDRQVRQWIALASRELGLMPTSEGALSLKLDLTQIIDGYAGTEHALAIAPLGRDVIQLVARSGVAYTTTLQIGNGGPEGQDYFLVRDRPGDDPKLNHFAPRFVVNVKTRQRTWRHRDEYLFPALAGDAAAIKRAGGIVGIGSHGEMPGLGMHWEMEAHVMGGMSPAEALHAATMGSAEAIGREQEFGSLEVGKFADLVILAKDPRQDIRHSLSIEAVMLNGRLRDDETLDEIWPGRTRLPEPWYAADLPPRAPSAGPALDGALCTLHLCDHEARRPE